MHGHNEVDDFTAELLQMIRSIESVKAKKMIYLLTASLMKQI